MGLMDSVLNGLGDQAAGGLGDLLQSQGGVAGLAERFGGAGMAETVQSWIGTGANLNITPEQISQVLGSGPVADFAARLGISPEQASETLAGLLPEAIDRLTPGGQLPGSEGGGGLVDLIGSLRRR
ncbi:MAG: DUF937 domain-containing protein [Brevundimonas sp.]|nr:DUF937 domain-containing protein [Brevundimonas sp.]